MNHNNPHRACSCRCCAGPQFHTQAVSRRQFLHRVGALTAGGFVLSALDSRAANAAPGKERPPRLKRRLTVQPVLTYEVPQRREATSWRSWGGIQTEQDAAKEKDRIAAELAQLQTSADFPLEILPVLTARNPEQAAAIAKGNFDTLVLYAAGGWVNTLQALIQKDRFNLMFLRHDPGPVYLWYEIAHPRFLRKTVDDYDPMPMDVHDVVVDQSEELLWRLRALHGLKSTLGKRIVAIGGPAGWGVGGRQAPTISKELWKLDLIDYPYKQLAPRLKDAFANQALVRSCEQAAAQYLQQSGVSLHTTREFVNNAFVLCEVLKDVMDEAETDAITINSCMGTIMPMSKTTACLPLSMLNDDGYLAFCESDFVVIPSGILLHYISDKPVFLNDPTFPHDGIVTLAHCTAPRRMDGQKTEPAKILTHFESDYGAAPKVEMTIGQTCTNLVPDFACKKWVGFEGSIVGNPFLDICRSQIDVRIKGDANALLEQMKGFHWMMSYGHYLRESGYALRKLGVEFLDVSASKALS